MLQNAPSKRLHENNTGKPNAISIMVKIQVEGSWGPQKL